MNEKATYPFADEIIIKYIFSVDANGTLTLLNTLRPWQNVRHVGDNNFEYIIVYENCCILI